MAKRPQFNLPSTKTDSAAPKSEWVYRSDDATPAAAATLAAAVAAAPVAATHADLIVDKYATYAAAAAIIPLPLFDMVAIGSVQLKMVAALAEHFNVPFNDDLGKSVIAALLGSVTATRLGSGVAGSLLKTIPVIGAIGGALAVPAVSYGVTYAIGRVFNMHFESGGTLLTIDPAAMRERFQGELAKATA
jgi:uncharacterized protein (DUF697 family)